MGAHLFCLHHAGGTTASFAAWRFTGIAVTKLGYRGSGFGSVADVADALAARIIAAPSPRLALYGHSMGAVLAFEIALRIQDSGRLSHVFLAAARPPSGRYDGGAAAVSAAAAAALAAEPGAAGLAGAATPMSGRAQQILREDLEILAAYPGRPLSDKLTVPGTILYSPRDPVAPAEECRRWAFWCRTEPDMHAISGGGHLFHRGNPEVLKIVEASLSSAQIQSA